MTIRFRFWMVIRHQLRIIKPIKDAHIPFATPGVRVSTFSPPQHTQTFIVSSPLLEKTTATSMEGRRTSYVASAVFASTPHLDVAAKLLRFHHSDASNARPSKPDFITLSTRRALGSSPSSALRNWRNVVDGTASDPFGPINPTPFLDRRGPRQNQGRR